VLVVLVPLHSEVLLEEVHDRDGRRLHQHLFRTLVDLMPT
jgi:hypothetical protein